MELVVEPGELFFFFVICCICSRKKEANNGENHQCMGIFLGKILHLPKGERNSSKSKLLVGGGLQGF